MRRRTFLKSSGLATLFFTIPRRVEPPRTHFISLSFDDGFKKSFYRIAEIHEKYSLKACLNIIASGHLPSFKGEIQFSPAMVDQKPVRQWKIAPIKFTLK
ncbi:MAG: hypothetical protein KDC53_08795 [Saprospiraceae bacterium]|nr:hypothetical protein [Saprospiraceae bacterium]